MWLLAPIFTIAVMIPFGIYYHRYIDHTIEEYNLKELNRRVTQMQAINDRLIIEVNSLKKRVSELENQQKQKNES